MEENPLIFFSNTFPLTSLPQGSTLYSSRCLKVKNKPKAENCCEMAEGKDFLLTALHVHGGKLPTPLHELTGLTEPDTARIIAFLIRLY